MQSLTITRQKALGGAEYLICKVAIQSCLEGDSADTTGVLETSLNNNTQNSVSQCQILMFLPVWFGNREDILYR